MKKQGPGQWASHVRWATRLRSEDAPRKLFEGNDIIRLPPVSARQRHRQHSMG